MSPARVEGAENIPPLAQALPGFDVAPRLFLLAPAGTPAEIVNKLSAAVKTLLEMPEVGAAASAQGTVRSYLGPGELAKEMADESARWKRIVTEQRITAEGN
jgi:tripartite-type tricarboxylate transporter receptor subunit TctC